MHRLHASDHLQLCAHPSLVESRQLRPAEEESARRMQIKSDCRTERQCTVEQITNRFNWRCLTLPDLVHFIVELFVSFALFLPLLHRLVKHKKSNDDQNEANETSDRTTDDDSDWSRNIAPSFCSQTPRTLLNHWTVDYSENKIVMSWKLADCHRLICIYSNAVCTERRSKLIYFFQNT